MKTLAKTLAVVALIAVSTFTMAAGKPEESNPKKIIVNLSTADLAIDHYVVINDHKIKAVAGISTVNIAAIYRNGWDGSIRDNDALSLLMMGADARVEEVQRND